MSQEIKIIPSNIQKFQQKSNTMLVSTGNAQKGAVQNRQKPEGSWNFSEADPLKYQPNNHYQFTISTGSAVLSTTQSYLSYTVQFALNNTFTAAGALKQVGKFFVQNRGSGPMWYFQRYVWASNTMMTNPVNQWMIDPSIGPYCVGLFPMNSCCIFKQSELNYRNLNEKDDYLFR